MYKILIVDDEVLARVATALISWEEHGFTIVGEAENGKSTRMAKISA